uniref:Uncharacterized protein n=1 Tax=Hyaloperonospora arabidopsidis (strain Emoy2) TaxID=559515 RepID=M4C114_HYAAE
MIPHASVNSTSAPTGRPVFVKDRWYQSCLRCLSVANTFAQNKTGHFCSRRFGYVAQKMVDYQAVPLHFYCSSIAHNGVAFVSKSLVSAADKGEVHRHV